VVVLEVVMPKGVYDHTKVGRKAARTRKINGSTWGEKNYGWKGMDANYFTIHRWVRDNRGSAKKCELSDETCSVKYEWSNVSGEYRRDLSDYRELCVSHHRRQDHARRRELVWKK
jgi:hypothetical protein